MKALLPVVFACVAALSGGCSSAANRDADLRQSALEEVKKRSAADEFEAAAWRGRVVFYATGSLLEGYALPGLTKEEVAFVESQTHEIVNEFPTDPAPFFAPQEYWDAVERFAYAYNRMVYQHVVKKRPNQPPQRNAGSRPSSGDSHASEIPSSLGPRG